MLDRPGKHAAKSFLKGILGWFILFIIALIVMFAIMGGPLLWQIYP
jgi:hypothetical protein